MKLNKNEDGRGVIAAGDHEENVLTSMYFIKPYISNPIVAEVLAACMEGCKI